MPSALRIGKEGKPFFFAGPNDHFARCEEILHALERVCGPDGYHYAMPIGATDFAELGLNPG